MIVELQTSVEKEVSIRTQIYRSLPRRLRLRPAISTRLFLPTRFRQLPETGHFLSTPTTTTFMLTVAGDRALPINTNYYNVYVDSWIYDKDKDIAGAKISYTECFPEVKQLPEWDSHFSGTHQNDGYGKERATFTFSKGCHIDKNVDAYFTDGYNNLTDELEFEIKENQIVITYPYLTSHQPDVRLLIRYESVYTRVLLDFE